MALRKENPKNKVGGRHIEKYDHKGKNCANIPPVGLATPQTDPRAARQKRHLDHRVFVPLWDEDESSAKSGPDLKAEIDRELTKANRGLERWRA